MLFSLKKEDFCKRFHFLLGFHAREAKLYPEVTLDKVLLDV